MHFLRAIALAFTRGRTWTAVVMLASAGGRHCPFKSQFRAPIFMQPRARRVSQGNQRIRGQQCPSLPLSLFMQYFGHGRTTKSDVGDLIIWFPLHGRPDTRGEAQWTLRRHLSANAFMLHNQTGGRLQGRVTLLLRRWIICLRTLYRSLFESISGRRKKKSK